MPYIGQTRALGIGKEVAIGTFVDPTRFLAYIPPATLNPKVNLLESKGVRAVPDIPTKVTQGRIQVGGKTKFELEPDNIGEVLQALFGLDTKTGPTDSAYTHTFVRQAVAQLPTYTVWVDQGAQYSEFGGCMASKADFAIKAGELIECDVEWVGTAYQASVTKSASYSTLQPFAFNTAVLKFGGLTINDYDDCKLSIDNMVKSEHVLNNSVYPGKIYTTGYRVSVALDIYLESTNLTQWSTNYLTTAAATFDAKLTHPKLIGVSTYYSLDFNIPVLYYKTAPLDNVQAALKIPFGGVAQYDLGGTNKTMTVTLVNDISSQY